MQVKSIEECSLGSNSLDQDQARCSGFGPKLCEQGKFDEFISPDEGLFERNM